MVRFCSNPTIRCMTNSFRTRVYANIHTGYRFRVQTLGVGLGGF